VEVRLEHGDEEGQRLVTIHGDADLAFDTATDVATSALVSDGGAGERTSRAVTVLETSMPCYARRRAYP
jgi:hypothetical protein